MLTDLIFKKIPLQISLNQKQLRRHLERGTPPKFIVSANPHGCPS